MELIKNNDLKMIFNEYIGKATDNKNLVYEARITLHYEPIIVFPDGDMVVIPWADIYNIAKEYRDKRYKEEENVDTTN